MQTTSTEFSCENFDDLQDKEVIKGVYACRADEADPGRLGTNVGSDGSGNSSGTSAAPRAFSSAMPTYSFFGLVAFLFML